MSDILKAAFWRSIGWMLLRTAGAALVPVIPALFADPKSAWLPALLSVGFVVVVAAASALAGLPDGTGPWWQVALQRAVRQFGQYVVGATAGLALISDLDWAGVLSAAAASAIATFILAALSLTPVPVLPKADPAEVADASGTAVESSTFSIHPSASASDGSE